MRRLDGGQSRTKRVSQCQNPTRAAVAVIQGAGNLLSLSFDIFKPLFQFCAEPNPLVKPLGLKPSQNTNCFHLLACPLRAR